MAAKKPTKKSAPKGKKPTPRKKPAKKPASKRGQKPTPRKKPAKARKPTPKRVAPKPAKVGPLQAANQEFEEQGARASMAIVKTYDRALAALSEEQAKAAVERVVNAEIDPNDAAFEKATELGPSLRKDPKDIHVDLTEAFWRGSLRGAREGYRAITEDGYSFRSHRSLPAIASGGVFGKVARALRG